MGNRREGAPGRRWPFYAIGGLAMTLVANGMARLDPVSVVAGMALYAAAFALLKRREATTTGATDTVVPDDGRSP